jgi:hypothetical protein
MRKTIATAALLFTLCCASFAGEVHTPGSPNPLPDPTPTPTSVVPAPAGDSTVNGEMPTPPGVSESLKEAALSLLAILPALF